MSKRPAVPRAVILSLSLLSWIVFGVASGGCSRQLAEVEIPKPVLYPPAPHPFFQRPMSVKARGTSDTTESLQAKPKHLIVIIDGEPHRYVPEK